MVEMRLEVEGLEELTRALAALPGQAMGEIAAAMGEAVHVVEGEVVDRTPVGAAGRGAFSRNLRQTITTEVRRDGNDVTGVVGTDVGYAPFVEKGTAPHWPPLQAIVEWVQFSGKFGPIGTEDLGMAKSIQKRIARRGTKGAFMFRDGLAAARNTVLDILGRAIERVMRQFK